MSYMPSKEKLYKYVELGMLKKQNHYDLPLNIYVYTEFTNFERLWNNVTLQARGLVLDEKGRCIIRCLPKFFNHNEPKPYEKQMHFTPDTRVFNKLDGSLDWLNDALFSYGADNNFRKPVKYAGLIMRNTGDRRDDTEVKSDIYEFYLKNLNLEAVIDDRPKVVRMWEEKGLKVINVGSGKEF